MNQLSETAHAVTDSASLADRFLPTALSVAGICMTIISIMLLINAAKLGIFVRMMLGFMGVLFVDSFILAFVATRIAIGRKGDATGGEKAVLLVLSFCMGIGLVID